MIVEFVNDEALNALEQGEITMNHSVEDSEVTAATLTEAQGVADVS